MMYLAFVGMCVLCSLNVYLFIEMGNAFSAAAAVFIALMCVRQAMFIADIEARKR
jgi:FtsH-binding integral membrane protein